MLQLIDIKHTKGRNGESHAAFAGSFLPPPSENSQNLYQESPLKKAIGEPKFEKKELPQKPNPDGSQGLQSDVSPDSQMFKQVVQNSSQIKNKFDRQTIINNFFNLQTTEVHLRNSNTDYSKSAASKASQPSPYIDVQKVFYQDFNNEDGSQATQHLSSNEAIQQQPSHQTNINSPTFGNKKEGVDNSGTITRAADGVGHSQPPARDDRAGETSQSSQQDKQDLTQEHYNQILNTVMNLHLLKQYDQLYK